MIAIITQARVNSSRLPNKIFLEASGKPFLYHHIERLKKVGIPIIVATTNNGSEKPIIDFCNDNNTFYYCGSETDVLARYYECAVKYNLSTIIRVTSDCPLIDANIILKGLALYFSKTDNKLVYVSNAIERTYPRGMDFEIFSFELLKEAFENAVDLSDREHVTPYIWKNKSGRVCVFHKKDKKDNSSYRITLDTEEDKNLLTALFETYNAQNLYCNDIIRILSKNPTLVALNAHIEQKKV